MSNHNQWMKEALLEAKKASDLGEVPVGAIVTRGDTVLSRSHNMRESLNNPVAHAEILALEQAAKTLGGWRLTGCSLYVTLEPCPMCAGALINSRISQLIYAATDPKAGAVNSLFSLLDDPRLNHQVDVVSGVLADESSALLKSFFAKLRSR